MSDWIYVDNSNVFIEGKRVSAVRIGLALDIFDAFDNRILDFDYRMSFGKLYEFVAGTDRTEVARAMLFGSRPPANDAIWDIAKRAVLRLSHMIATSTIKKRRLIPASWLHSLAMPIETLNLAISSP